MLIAHLSDLHIFSTRPETPPVRLDIARAVERIVADINLLPSHPCAVLITGDIADGGSAADYALVQRLLSPLAMPVFVVPGNHDRRHALREAFAATVPFAEGPFLNFTAAVDDLHFIGLDTVIAGRVEGELCASRLGWLREQLAQTSGPVFLLAHHPPFATGNAHWDTTGLVKYGPELKEVIEREEGRVRLLCGHVHRAMHSQWAGGYASIGGSPAFSYEFSAGSAHEPELANLPYSYILHHREADGSFTVHNRYVALD